MFERSAQPVSGFREVWRRRSAEKLFDDEIAGFKHTADVGARNFRSAFLQTERLVLQKNDVPFVHCAQQVYPDLVIVAVVQPDARVVKMLVNKPGVNRR